MAIKMVREPSETPNINNIDDIVPMRYAYGNQDGYVIGKGTEISNTVNGLNFTVNSGRLVLQGVECDIDASGVTITIDNIATTRYYVVYLQVNLGLNSAQILSTCDTATYPTIDAGDDLTENTTGIARLPLYRFIATSGVISNVNKVVESIKYIKDVKVNNSENSNISDFAIKPFSNNPTNSGTIDERLGKIVWTGNETPIDNQSETYFEIPNTIQGDTIDVTIHWPQHYYYKVERYIVPSSYISNTISTMLYTMSSGEHGSFLTISYITIYLYGNQTSLGYTHLTFSHGRETKIYSDGTIEHSSIPISDYPNILSVTNIKNKTNN